MKVEQINELFTYHPPHGNQAERYEKLREKYKELALFINENTPESREQALAITHLQISSMCCNASIAINEKKN